VETPLARTSDLWYGRDMTISDPITTLSRVDAKLVILLIDNKLDGLFEHHIAELRAKAVAVVGEPGPEPEYHDYAGQYPDTREQGHYE
jgi:hypothetical protein